MGYILFWRNRECLEQSLVIFLLRTRKCLDQPLITFLLRNRECLDHPFITFLRRNPGCLDHPLIILLWRNRACLDVSLITFWCKTNYVHNSSFGHDTKVCLLCWRFPLKFNFQQLLCAIVGWEWSLRSVRSETFPSPFFPVAIWTSTRMPHF